ncbi:unknown [Clostridium sp. CAG:448]|nr:unknown [Clostridium sp. CAG:448]
MLGSNHGPVIALRTGNISQVIAASAEQVGTIPFDSIVITACQRTDGIIQIRKRIQLGLQNAVFGNGIHGGTRKGVVLDFCNRNSLCNLIVEIAHFFILVFSEKRNDFAVHRLLRRKPGLHIQYNCLQKVFCTLFNQVIFGFRAIDTNQVLQNHISAVQRKILELLCALWNRISCNVLQFMTKDRQGIILKLIVIPACCLIKGGQTSGKRAEWYFLCFGIGIRIDSVNGISDKDQVLSCAVPVGICSKDVAELIVQCIRLSHFLHDLPLHQCQRIFRCVGQCNGLLFDHRIIVKVIDQIILSKHAGILIEEPQISG